MNADGLGQIEGGRKMVGVGGIEERKHSECILKSDGAFRVNGLDGNGMGPAY